MPQVSPLELEHCKELVMSPGSLFEFTSRFISHTRQQQLLALYALTQSIGSIPDAPVDDAVKWAKLKWWGDELLSEPDAPSRHPVLRALWQSGARQHLDNSLLLQLVSDAVMRIDNAPDADENAMFARLETRGETEVLLELALDDVTIDAQSLGYLAAASSLYDMISAYRARPGSDTLQLPLDMLAKYQLKPAQLGGQSPAQELLIILSQLAAKGVEWFAQGSVSLDTAMPAACCVHLQLRWMMEARILARRSRRVAAYLRHGDRFGPTDAWQAWRFCRGRLQ